MTIEEAYNFLGLEVGASEELIQKKFKNLLKKIKLDDPKTAELNIARDTAIAFIQNKNTFALATRQVKDLIIAERQLQAQKEEYKSEVKTLYKKLDKTEGTYKFIKTISIFIGLFAGIFTLLASNILPILQQEGQDAFKRITTYFLICGTIIGFIYIVLSYLEKKVKDRIERFKDTLNSKKIVVKLLLEILFLQQEREKELKRKPKSNIKEFSEINFERSVNDWMNKKSNYKERRSHLQIIYSDEKSIKKTARQMGTEDFTKLLLLKSQEKGLIEDEIDFDKNDVKYRITQELEELQLKYKKDVPDRKTSINSP